MSDNPEIPKRGRGRPKGSKNVKREEMFLQTDLSRREKTEVLLDRAYYLALKSGQNDYKRIKYMQVYANLLRSAAAGKLEVDATVNLKQALEAFYGVKKG